MRPTIFISYRREDSQHVTGRLYDRLKARFGGNVMLDIDSFPLGVDFRDHINRSLQDCKCVLAVIGDEWVDIRYNDGPLAGSRRIDDPADFVRVEIQVALDRGIPVIPVLVGNASMPDTEKLPAALQPLVFRNGMELRSGRDFDSQIDRLMTALQSTAVGNLRTRSLALLSAVVVVALGAAWLGTLAWSARSTPEANAPQQPGSALKSSGSGAESGGHLASQPMGEAVVSNTKFGTSPVASRSNVARQRRAVLIGIDQYKNIPSLKFCAADAWALRDELIAGGFLAENISLLNSESAERRLPTKAHLAEQIHATLSTAQPDDFVLLAFSGTGLEIDGARFFCPSDANPAEVTTLLPFDWLCDELRACPAALKVVLVDACRIHHQAKNAEQAGKVPIVSGGCLILSSCSSGEIACESDEARHGVFMNYVLKGLAGQADSNKDGRVTVLELWDYAAPATEAFVESRYRQIQRPTLEGNLTSEFREFGLVEYPAEAKSIR